MKKITQKLLNEYLWEGADTLRGICSNLDVLQVLFRLLTLKVLNDNSDHPFIIPNAARWISVRSGGRSIAENINFAMKEIEDANPKLKCILSSYSFIGLENDYLLKLLQHMDKYNLDRERMEDPEPATGTLAIVVEEMIQRFSPRNNMNQFVSPKEVGNLLACLLTPGRFGIDTIYDPTAGMSNALVEAGKCANDPARIRLEGQEINEAIRGIGQMNLILHGFYNAEIKGGDIIRHPLWMENGTLKKYDYIVMDTPIGLKNWGREDAEADPYGRFRYGLPGLANGEMAFIMHVIASLSERGKAIVVVPPGVLFRGGMDQEIRQRIIENDLVETVIALPPNLYPGTSIPFSVIIFNKNKDIQNKGKIQFVDAAEGYQQGKTRGLNVLRSEDIVKIAETYYEKIEVEQYSCQVDISEVEKANWNLNTRRYMGQVEIESKIGPVKVNAEAFMEDEAKKVKLGSIASLFRGILPPKQTLPEGQSYTHRLINLSDVQEGRIVPENLSHVNLKEQRSSALKYEVYPGDVILSSRGTTIKVAVIPQTNEKMVISNNFIGIRLYGGFEPFYIKAYLESPIGLHFLQAHQYGSAVNTLNTKDVSEMEILDVPLEVQKNITNIITKAEETYLERIAAAKEEYKEQYQQLYRRMDIDRFMKQED